MQRSAIEQGGARRGDVVARWYVETESASTLVRPVLRRLRADIRRGEISRCYVWALDRLSRSGIRDTFAVVDEMRHCGCELVSLSDPFDFGGPGADMVLAMLAWSAQMERRRIGERIAAARERVEREGGSWGRPPIANQNIVREVRRQRALHRSLRNIAEHLRISKSLVHEIVSGKGRYGSPRFRAEI